MAERRIPIELEEPRLGMNTIESPKKLLQHVSEKLINAFPGVSIKPRNGNTELYRYTDALGNNGSHTMYSPESISVTKGDKEYIITWNRGISDNDTYHGIEILCITDGTRTVLDLGNFLNAGVGVSFTSLHDSIYMTIEQEFLTNQSSQYRTRNKVLDYINGSWVIREMGYSITPNVQEIYPVISTGVGALGARTKFASCVWNNEVWVHGGTDSDDVLGDLYRSFDGKQWTQITVEAREYLTDGGEVVTDDGIPLYDIVEFPKRMGHTMTVFNNKLFFIGGEDETGTRHNDIWYTENGTVWIKHYAASSFTERANYGFVVHDSKLWIVAGVDDSDTDLEDAWNSTDGLTWNEVTVSSGYGARSGHVTLSYDNKIWVQGGVGIDDIYSTTDGATWTLVDATPGLGTRSNHSAVVYNGKMWIAGGNDDSTLKNDIYYSTDGATWTLVQSNAEWFAREGFVLLNFLNDMLLFCGNDGTDYYSDGYTSDDGITWESTINSLTIEKYYSYTWIYVRRTDEYAVLASDEDRRFESWETQGVTQLVGTDEKLLTGTVTLSGNDLTGTGTLFSTELVVGKRVRLNGLARYAEVLTITSDTVATISNDNSDALSDVKYALLPDVGDSITTDEYLPGDCQGEEEINFRRVIYTFSTTDYSRVFVQIEDSVEARAQGATHVRIYRTLGADTQTVVRGLTHAYLADVALGWTRLYKDDRSDTTHAGETNSIETTGLSAPPLGRYGFYADGRFWIGGNDSAKGYWYASVQPMNTAYPKSYASLFDTELDVVSFDPDDGQRDTAGFEFLGDVYLCKERKISCLKNGDITLKPDTISHYIGVACPNSVAKGVDPVEGKPAVYFISESGPAILTAGGRVRLLTEFRIKELWPESNVLGILKKADGSPTDWYTRSKVKGVYWYNAYWVLFGDSEDASCQLTESKIFGIYYAKDAQSYGGFQYTFDSPVTGQVFEPQTIIPFDNVSGYCLSHKGNIYRVTKVLDSVAWVDSYNEGNASIETTWKPRPFYVGPYRDSRAIATKIFNRVDFADTDGLEVTIEADGARITLPTTYTQERQSGVSGSGSEAYRETEVISLVDGVHGARFSIETKKTIPTDGDVEIHCPEIEIVPTEQGYEFQSASGSFPSTTFVVKADAVPEVDAYA
jgi:hypothetical protein